MCIASVVYCTLHPLYKLYVRLVCLRREILPTLDGPSTPLDTEQIDHQHQHRHQHQHHHQHQHQHLLTPCKYIFIERWESDDKVQDHREYYRILQIDHQHRHQHRQERQHVKNNVCLGRLTTSPCGISITAIPAIPRMLSILKKIKRFFEATEL